jgi:hypothetical protein
MPVEFWAAWIVLFLVGEIIAVIRGKGTLTHYVKRFFRVKGPELRWSAGRLALIGTCLYLLLHFLDKVP